ncbi:hypothetical protein QQM39_22995 [Streptomyces sp. DT2A-34]|uniref:hypothetical protein n=1 Tax=Streptomyces sp. DT2A-34 TaxID=3051182 RepID=UPI00265C2560|nr:hypothetical protein [Streptomyces sp. DT2A-34]MDO0913602.1 hypothetical protein [Streptomyces sp. DT2A-34]
MRRHLAAPVLLALLLSACAANDGDVNSKASASSPPSTAAANAKQASEDALALPEKPDFLLPVTKGTDSRALPAFTPSENVYTIHARCKGKGTVTIQYGPKDSDPSKIACGGPVTIGRVYTAPNERKHLSVKVDGTDVHWSVAVLSGTHAMR